MQSDLTLEVGKVIGINIGGNKFHSNDAHTRACERLLTWSKTPQARGGSTNRLEVAKEALGRSYVYEGRMIEGKLAIERDGYSVLPILVSTWDRATRF